MKVQADIIRLVGAGHLVAGLLAEAVSPVEEDHLAVVEAQEDFNL